MLDLTNDDIRTDELLDGSPVGVFGQTVWARFDRKHVREMLELEQALAKDDKRSERFEHVIKLALCEGYITALTDLGQTLTDAEHHTFNPPWLVG